MRGIQVGRLAGVYDRSAADRDIAVEFAFAGELCRRKKGLVGRLDLDLVVDHHVNAGRLECVAHLGDIGQAAQFLVGEQRYARHAQ